jgi:pSer/pThr/pTyr-binding forkhead associated (FHA) protein
VEAGPDTGRRITVPPAGGRIGRSSQNDIELTDPSVSRFQCRVFFKPDGLLWVADLGSTNETLLNGAGVLEARSSRAMSSKWARPASG